MKKNGINMGKSELEEFLADIRDSRQWKEKNYNEKYRGNYRDYNESWNTRDEDEIKIESSEAFKLIYVLMPQLIFSDPNIVVKPLKKTTNIVAQLKKELLTRA